MIISISYLIISFLLEGIMSNIFISTLSNISYFTTIYTIIALIVIYPYFDNDRKYFVLVIIFGILFDVLYTSSILVNTFIFIIIGIVVKILYNLFSDNIFMTNVISYIGIIIYHLLSYIVLSIVGYSEYNIMLLIDIIVHSIFMTVIYTSISYFMIKGICSKRGIKYIK